MGNYERELAVIFPKVYDPWKPTTTDIIAEWTQSWLSMMLVVSGWSIHHLVNDGAVKHAVRCAWKARRENWEEYLDWVSKLVGFGD